MEQLRGLLKEAAIRSGEYVYNELLPKPIPDFGIVIKVVEEGDISKVYVFSGQHRFKRNVPYPLYEEISVPIDQIRQQEIKPSDLVLINETRDGVSLFSRFENIIENSSSIGAIIPGKGMRGEK